MSQLTSITIIIVALLGFAGFVVWRVPQGFGRFFGNAKHQGAMAATILSAIPAAAAFVPALAKFQDVLIALVIGICGAWGIAIHGSPASPPSPPSPASAPGADPPATPADDSTGQTIVSPRAAPTAQVAQVAQVAQAPFIPAPVSKG